MRIATEEPDIVQQAFCMSAATERFMEKARAFYYAVMLSGHTCPACGGGLEMIRESACICGQCGCTFDPTIAFQLCETCGGRVKLAVRRYRCSKCTCDVPSRFLFDGLVFDAEYFREKMAESRENKRELRERVRQLLAESRSTSVSLPSINLTASPGLLQALSELVQASQTGFELTVPPSFSLSRYQTHVQANLRPIAISLEQIPPLSENTRLDRIWRFVAIIFLAHAGILDVWQDGPTIKVKQRETDTEGHGIPGDREKADGIA